MPRDAIIEVEDFVDELDRNYHRVDGYSLKAKLKEARERAGQLLLELADDELVLGWRDSEWTGIAPFLEEDVAFSSIAQNEIGHARALYELLPRPDDRGRARVRPRARRVPLRAARRAAVVPDWAPTIARRWLYELADAMRHRAR